MQPRSTREPRPLIERAARRLCALAALVFLLYLANGRPASTAFDMTPAAHAVTATR